MFLYACLLCYTMQKNSIPFMILIPNFQKRDSDWPSYGQKIRTKKQTGVLEAHPRMHEKRGWLKGSSEAREKKKGGDQFFLEVVNRFWPESSWCTELCAICLEEWGHFLPLGVVRHLLKFMSKSWCCPRRTAVIQHPFLHPVLAQHLPCTRYTA